MYKKLYDGIIYSLSNIEYVSCDSTNNTMRLSLHVMFRFMKLFIRLCSMCYDLDGSMVDKHCSVGSLQARDVVLMLT